ncbi:ABC transporter substrate-binding protein [Caenispirillum salinarum]|uniref:ABC transporter substrate-binding protein n=1 Tax=Caenispirillum salinarum TaxID=859058 RepID=UPI003851639F
MIKRAAIGAVSALALTLGAGQAMAEMKIGALVPLTGDLQAYGETSLNGIKLAAKHINEQGGVLGGDAEIAVGDTQTTPQVGVDAAQKLVNVEGVAGIVGALSSGVTIPAASSVTSQAGVPQISGASTSPEITTLNDNDFLFRTVPTDAVQGIALSEITNTQGHKSVGVVYINNDYGAGLAQAFSEAYKASGGKIAGSVAYEKGQASYRGELQRAAEGGADALVLIGYPENGITIIRQALEGGYFSKFVLSDGMKAPEIIDSIGADYMNGSVGTAPAAAGKGAEMFKEAYEAEFGELPPKPYIDSAYDATFLLALAAEKAGSDDPKAVRDALRDVSSPPGIEVLPGEWEKAKKLIANGQDIDYQGAAGPVNFDVNGDVLGTYEEWTVEDGKIVSKRIFLPES